LVFRGDDEFLASTLPFITDGLQADQPVLVAVTPPRIELGRRCGLVDYFHPAVSPLWIKHSRKGGQPFAGCGDL
jgi:hypothetical protein